MSSTQIVLVHRTDRPRAEPPQVDLVDLLGVREVRPQAQGLRLQLQVGHVPVAAGSGSRSEYAGRVRKSISSSPSATCSKFSCLRCAAVFEGLVAERLSQPLELLVDHTPHVLSLEVPVAHPLPDLEAGNL